MARYKSTVKLPAKYKTTNTYKIRGDYLCWEGNYDNCLRTFKIINIITDTADVKNNAPQFLNVAKRKLHDYLYNTLVNYDYRLFEKVRKNSEIFLKS